MKKNKRLSQWIIWAFAAIALIVAAVIFIFFSQPQNIPSVILPTAQPTASLAPDDNDRNGLELTVAPDTVQAVIKTLTRVENYQRTLMVSTFSSAKNSSSTLQVWAKGESFRIISQTNNEIKNILIDGDELWIWYDSQDEVFHGETFGSSDEYQRIMTYEDFLLLDESVILDAGYESYNGEICIWAKYVTSPFNYTNLIRVSVTSGLLMSTETYSGDTLIYSMSSDLPDISTPDDNVFMVP